MPQVPHGSAPDRIDIAPDVFAMRVGKHYALKFPYNTGAIARVKSAISAHWFPPGGGWMMDAFRYDAVRNVLVDIDKILGPRAGVSSAVMQSKMIIAASCDHTVGQVINHDDGPITIVRLGACFTATKSQMRSGHPDLVGHLVRYAYHHPSTPAEIEASIASNPVTAAEPRETEYDHSP